MDLLDWIVFCRLSMKTKVKSYLLHPMSTGCILFIRFPMKYVIDMETVIVIDDGFSYEPGVRGAVLLDKTDVPLLKNLIRDCMREYRIEYDAWINATHDEHALGLVKYPEDIEAKFIRKLPYNMKFFNNEVLSLSEDGDMYDDRITD